MAYSLAEFFKQRARPTTDSRAHRGVPLFAGPIVLPSRHQLLAVLLTHKPIVVCDSGVFSGACVDFSIGLLRGVKTIVPPEVDQEIGKYVATAPRTDDDAAVISELRRATTRPNGPTPVFWNGSRFSKAGLQFYGGLLGLRKTYPLSLTGTARSALAGLSVGSSIMSKKKGAGVTAADEAVVALSFILAAAHQDRRVVLLTRDNDVALQAYKLASLLRDDYTSFLVAHDRRERPFLYGESISLRGKARAEQICTPDVSYAVSRALMDPYHLIPQPIIPFNLAVVLLSERPEIRLYNTPRGQERMFEIKGSTAGRNTHLYGDLNCYANVRILADLLLLDPRPGHYLFFLRDLPFPIQGAQQLGFSISIVDGFRSLADLEEPLITHMV